MSRAILEAFLQQLNSNLKFSMYDVGGAQATDNASVITEAVKKLTDEDSEIHAALVGLSDSDIESQRAVAQFFQAVHSKMSNVQHGVAFGSPQYNQLSDNIASLTRLEARINSQYILTELDRFIDSEPTLSKIQKLLGGFKQERSLYSVLLKIPTDDDTLDNKLALIERLQKLAFYIAKRVGLSSEAEVADKPRWELCKTNAVTLFYAAADSLDAYAGDYKLLLSMQVNAFFQANIVGSLTEYNPVSGDTTWKPGVITEQQLKVWNTMILRLGAKEMFLLTENAADYFMGDCEQYIEMLKRVREKRAEDKSSCLRAAAFGDGASVSSASDSEGGVDVCSAASAPTEDVLASAEIASSLHVRMMAVPPPSSQAVEVSPLPSAPTAAQLLAGQRQQLVAAMAVPATSSSGVEADSAMARHERKQ